MCNYLENKMKVYIKELIKDKNVGAITSTSSHAVMKLVKKINFKNAETIIEYGPGCGVITKILLENMKLNASLYVFETNKNFIETLSEINDKRLFIINADAESAEYVLKTRYQIDRVDNIISTIPFTFFKMRKRKRIIFKSFKLLNENGRFITYQYSWLIFSLMKRHFKNVNWEVELFSFPPSVLIDGIK